MAERLKKTAIALGTILTLGVTGCTAPAVAEGPKTTQVPPTPNKTPGSTETATANNAEVEKALESSDLPWGTPEAGGYKSVRDFPFLNPATGKPFADKNGNLVPQDKLLEAINNYYAIPVSEFPTEDDAHRELMEKLNVLLHTGVAKSEIDKNAPSFKNSTGELGGPTAASALAYYEQFVHQITDGKSLDSLTQSPNSYKTLGKLVCWEVRRKAANPDYTSALVEMNGGPVGNDLYVNDFMLKNNAQGEYTGVVSLTTSMQKSKDGKNWVLNAFKIKVPSYIANS